MGKVHWLRGYSGRQEYDKAVCGFIDKKYNSRMILGNLRTLLTCNKCRRVWKKARRR